VIDEGDPTDTSTPIAGDTPPTEGTDIRGDDAPVTDTQRDQKIDLSAPTTDGDPKMVVGVAAMLDDDEAPAVGGVPAASPLIEPSVAVESPAVPPTPEPSISREATPTVPETPPTPAAPIADTPVEPTIAVGIDDEQTQTPSAPVEVSPEPEAAAPTTPAPPAVEEISAEPILPPLDDDLETELLVPEGSGFPTAGVVGAGVATGVIIGVGASRRRLKFAALDASDEPVRTWAEFVALKKPDREALLAVRLGDGKDIAPDYMGAIISVGNQLHDWAGRNDGLLLSPGFITHEQGRPTLVLLGPDGAPNEEEQEMSPVLVVEITINSRADEPVSSDVARALGAATHWRVEVEAERMHETVIDAAQRTFLDGLQVSVEGTDS